MLLFCRSKVSRWLSPVNVLFLMRTILLFAKFRKQSCSMLIKMLSGNDMILFPLRFRCQSLLRPVRDSFVMRVILLNWRSKCSSCFNPLKIPAGIDVIWFPASFTLVDKTGMSCGTSLKSLWFIRTVEYYKTPAGFVAHTKASTLMSKLAKTMSIAAILNTILL